jgi:hypothetical protein
MILRSLELKHFGLFGERTFEFRRGLNLVSGPNETGKSTLMEAVPAVLFGVPDKDRFRPWGKPEQCGAALIMETGDRTLRIERDILADRVTLTELDGFHQTLYRFEGCVPPGVSSPQKTEYREKLAEVFAVAEETLFRTSFFFDHGSLERPEGMGKKLRALLSGVVPVGPVRVLQSLEGDYLALTRENPWGPDQDQDKELEVVRKKLGDLEARWLADRGPGEEVDRLWTRIREMKGSIELDKGEFEKGERYLAWARQRWEEQADADNPQPAGPVEKGRPGKAGELEKQQRELYREILKTGLPREIPDDLPLILSEAEKIRKDMVSLQAESAELRKKLLEQGPARIGPFLGLSGLFLACGALLAWMRPQWLGYALMGAGLLTAPVWLVYLWRAGIRRAERGRIKGQAQVLENRREAAQGQLATLDERFEGIGMSPSAVEIVRMQKNLDRHRQMSQKLLEVEGALKALEEMGSAQESEQASDAAPQQGGTEPERRPLPLLPREELPEAEAKLSALGESIQERENLLADLMREEGEFQDRTGEKRRIEEEGEALREREKALVQRKKILGLGHDLLAGAIEEFRANHLKGVALEAGRQIAAVTGGRYRELRFDEGLNCSLRDRDGTWQPLECFSRGTADAVCMGIRLALSGGVSSGPRLPLFLDDPLVSMDRLRAAESLRMFERLSSDHQVILFSHDENLRKRAARDRWHVISLKEGGAGGKNQEQERNEDGGQLYLL